MLTTHNKQVCPYCNHENTVTFKKSTITCEKCRNLFELAVKQSTITRYTNNKAQAELGNDLAQVKLGYEFYYQNNYDAAIYWASKALDKRPLEANTLLGRTYFYQYLEKKIGYQEAMKHLMAANQKDPDVLLSLGYLHIWNNENRDHRKSVEYFSRELLKNNKDANYRLALAYFSGLGVKRDYIKSKAYCEKAVELGNKYAVSLLGFHYSKGKGCERNDLLALHYYRLAANMGDETAINNIGSFYAKGRVVPKNYTKAAEYYKKASDMDYYYSRVKYAELLYYGKGLKANKSEAKKMLKDLIKKDFKYAKTILNRIEKKAKKK